MNGPWQSRDAKRFRPNEPPPSGRGWIPPPAHMHVHPSRQSQVPHSNALPPPPPIAPYHASAHPAAPPVAPYYNMNINHHHYPPMHPHAPLPSHPPQHPHSRRNKSMDPRQRGRHHITDTELQSEREKEKTAILDVLHIAADETKNFGAFAVTLSQIYGSRNTDRLPFGSSSVNSIEFDGRIGSAPILSFLPEAIDTPSKKVRVYELAPLAATDKRSYDELLAFFTKHERCPVVDKEYNMGILLYFVPPKLIFKKVDPTNLTNKEKDKRNKHKHKHKNKHKHSNASTKTNFVELLKLNASNSNLNEDRLWMISITSSSKYLMFKQKQKEKGKQSNHKKKKKKKKNEADISDIEISSDQDDSENEGNDEADSDDSDEDRSCDIDMAKKKKGDAIIKSDLIVALEELYNKIGQKLPD